MPLVLQDGSDIICLGVDTLNTETLEVGKAIMCGDCLRRKSQPSLNIFSKISFFLAFRW